MLSQSWANQQIEEQISQNKQSQQQNLSLQSAQKRSEQLYSLPSFGLLANDAQAAKKSSPVQRIASPPPVKHTFGVQEKFQNQNQSNNIFFNRNHAENINSINNFSLNNQLVDSYQGFNEQIVEEVKQPIYVKKTPASQQIDQFYVEQRPQNFPLNFDNLNLMAKEHAPQMQINQNIGRPLNFMAEEKKSQQNFVQVSSGQKNNSEKVEDFQYANFIDSPPGLLGQVDLRSQQAQARISPAFRSSQQNLNLNQNNQPNSNGPANLNKPQQFSYAMPLLGFQQQQPQIIQGTQFVYGGGRLLEGFMQMPSEIFNQHQQYVVVANINNQNNIHVFEQSSSIPQNNQPNDLQNVQNIIVQPLISQQQPIISNNSNNNIQQNNFSQREQLQQSVNSVQSISQRGQNSLHASNISSDRYSQVSGVFNMPQQQEISQALNLNDNFPNFGPVQLAPQQQLLEEDGFRNQFNDANRFISFQDPFVQELNVPDLVAIEENRSDDDSQLSSIPSEHENGMNSNEYIRRYALNIVTITWNRDSHGLFDFEVRQLARQNFQTAQEQNFIRIGEGCRLIDTSVDLRSEFHKKAQLLMHIKSWRNFFLLQTPVKYMLSHAQSEAEINLIQNRDVEMFYSDQGEQLLQPYDMCERMYLVVRSIINDGNVQQDYELKKGDIIKVGRAKFLVRDINIVKKNEQLNMRKEKILKRRKEFIKLIARQRAQSQEKIIAHPTNPHAKIYLQINQNNLERRPLHRGDTPNQNQRSNSEVIIDTFQNNLQNQQLRGPSQVNNQANQSISSATHITDQVIQQIQKELSEEGVQFPEYLNEVKSENSSDESFRYKRKRPSYFVPEEESKSEKNFKKIIKKYVNLDMAPLAGLQAQPQASQNPAQLNSANNPSDQNSKLEGQKKQDNNNESDNGNKNDKERDTIPVVESFQSKQVPEQMGLDSSSPYCRFCWVNEHDLQNPLISSCKCSGGVQYVHYECLKMWIKTKMIQQSTQRISMYYWKTFECEICKSSFPFRFKTQNGIKYNLFDLNVSKQKNYLVLEGINIEKTSSKMIYILRPEQEFQIFKMGRANDQDIRINDISVSRQHANILFDNSKFLIKDNLSKFGTLIQIQKYLDLKPNQTRILQVGRTIMNVSLRSIKRPPAKGNSIMWKDENKGLPILNPLLSQANVVRNLMDNQKNVKELVDRIKNAESYIKQQSNVHRRLIANGNLESQTYNIERRQMNANLDDFYKNQAIDDSQSSQDPEDNEEEAKHLECEESKGVSPPRNQQIFRQNSNNLNQNISRNNPAPNQERRIPLGRVFIDNDEDLIKYQQQQQRHSYR